MNAAVRNIAVGLTVLVALIVLGGLIVLFGGRPQALESTYQVRIQFPDAGPIDTGSEVRVSGVTVGQVSRVRPMNNFRDGVMVYADIKQGFDIPRDSEATIQPRVLGIGKPTIDIRVHENAGPEMISKDGKAMLAGVVLTGFEGMFPEEAKERLARVAQAIEEMLGTSDSRGATTQPDKPSIRRLMTGLNELLAHVNGIMGDEGSDIRATLQNLSAASADIRASAAHLTQFMEQAKGLPGHLDRTLGQADQTLQTARDEMTRLRTDMSDSLTKLAATLDRANKLIDAVSHGRGTAAKLVNDPRLFDELVLTVDRMNQTLAQLQELLKIWASRGVQLKM
ncbi:MAG: hypothetical protein BIFFINMI_02869 [Phycisphaerae bacterium]|nr:hypothetical protein [Phycisphaerae bacterium]